MQYLGSLKLAIDQESVNIYFDNGEDQEPVHVVYWHLEEVEEDANVAISIANAIDLFHSDREELLERLGWELDGGRGRYKDRWTWTI